jgi:hypothetical protein
MSEFGSAFHRPENPRRIEELPNGDLGGRKVDLTEADKPLFGNRQERPLPVEWNEKMDRLLAKLDKDFGKPSPEEGAEGLMPVNEGKWKDGSGESVWHPDPEYVPKKSNPEGKTWEEIQGKYGTDGIPFKDGFPDFSEVSKGDVTIDDFTDNRDKNFRQADIELAEQKGCTPEEVEKWRKENGYTWHECEDMKTMQKVPCDVHNNVPHSGGVSEAKKAEQSAST